MSKAVCKEFLILLAFLFASIFIDVFDQGLARISSTEEHFTTNGHQRCLGFRHSVTQKWWLSNVPVSLQ